MFFRGDRRLPPGNAMKNPVFYDLSRLWPHSGASVPLCNCPLSPPVSALLDEIEAGLGYGLPLRLFAPGHGRGSYAASGIFEGTYQVFVHPRTRLTDALVCHELLHIKLFLEGWPQYGFDPPEHSLEAEKILLAEYVGSMLEHLEIRPRMVALGIDPREEVVPGFAPTVWQRLHSRTLGRNFSEPLVFGAASLFLAELMLFPDMEPDSAAAFEHAREHCANLYRTAGKVAALCRATGRVTPENFDPLQRGVFTLLGLHRDFARRELSGGEPFAVASRCSG